MKDSAGMSIARARLRTHATRVTRAVFARANCPRCKGRGEVAFPAKEYRGTKLVREWTYMAECPWCSGAQAWLEGTR